MKKTFHNVEVDSAPVQSVKKAMDLLDRVIQAGLRGQPATLTQLAGQAGMPANTVRNLLKTLVACGYLRQRHRGQYEMGPACRQLGRMNRMQAGGTQRALLASLRRFAERCGETCVLASLVNGERVILAQVDSTQAVRVSHAMVSDDPFFSKPTGRMLAATAGEGELRQVIARHGMPGRHWDGIRSERALREALAALREQGVCVIEDTEQQVVAIAVPVCPADEDARCVLGAFAPLYRCDLLHRDKLIEGLRQTAGEIADILGESDRAIRQ